MTWLTYGKQHGSRHDGHRSKRQIGRELTSDGVPITVQNEGSYTSEDGTVSSGGRQNTEGLRIYEGMFYQTVSNSIPVTRQNGAKAGQAIDLPNKNRAKQTSR